MGSDDIDILLLVMTRVLTVLVRIVINERIIVMVTLSSMQCSILLCNVCHRLTIIDS